MLYNQYVSNTGPERRFDWVLSTGLQKSKGNHVNTLQINKSSKLCFGVGAVKTTNNLLEEA